MRTIRDLVFVITGASPGIGGELALEIASQGGKLALASGEPQQLRELAAACQRHGGRALPVTTDVANERDVMRLVREASDVFGRIDVWITIPELSLYQRFNETLPATYQQIIERNLFGCINCARAVLPHFRRAGRGILINCSLTADETGAPFHTAHAASFCGIQGWDACLRMELLDVPEIHVCTVFASSDESSLSPGRMIAAIVECSLNPKPEVWIRSSRPRPSLAARACLPRFTSKAFAKWILRDGTAPSATLPQPLPHRPQPRPTS